MAIPLSNHCLRAVSAELASRGIAFTVEQGRKHPSIRFQVNGIELRKPFAGSSSCQSAPHKAAADIRRLIRNAEQQEPPMTGVSVVSAGIDASRQPVVSIDRGEAMADSRDIASFFGKQHSDVVRTIRALTCSTEFTERNFTFCEEIQQHSTGAAKSVFVQMTKDGFMFLVMGFNGSKAAQFKERYIAQFNAMEAELRRRSFPASVDAKTIGGIVKSVLNKQLEDVRAGVELALEEVSRVNGRISHLLPGQPDLTIARDFWLSVQIAEKAGFKEGDRVRGLTQFITRELHRHCAAQGVPVRLEEAVGRPARYLFPVPIATAWLAGCGTARIRHFVERVRAKKSGQGTLALIHRR
ncbi:hypothetical protein CHELA1G11_12012 [Hyphomicrobiales bacterium]|nr:hypothetical protein CHELA1G11_12012 [Hyphomicrobiales bacterium]CAH1663906.1 hypothetical protein CHELA1G2_12300 [Hyphomicrobiales bacterium]